jgi:hypothetical protein
MQPKLNQSHTHPRDFSFVEALGDSQSLSPDAKMLYYWRRIVQEINSHIW